MEFTWGERFFHIFDFHWALSNTFCSHPAPKSLYKGEPLSIFANHSRVNDPPILAQKQQKMGIFDKTDFWGLKYSLEMRVQQ